MRQVSNGSAGAAQVGKAHNEIATSAAFFFCNRSSCMRLMSCLCLRARSSSAFTWAALYSPCCCLSAFCRINSRFFSALRESRACCTAPGVHGAECSQVSQRSRGGGGTAASTYPDVRLAALAILRHGVMF